MKKKKKFLCLKGVLVLRIKKWGRSNYILNMVEDLKFMFKLILCINRNMFVHLEIIYFPFLHFLSIQTKN